MKLLPRLAAAGLSLSAAAIAAGPVFTLGLLAPRAVHAAEDAAAEVSFDFFYNNLADQGDWYNTPDYGYVWQPYIAYKNDQWRPYTDGYWAETDQGWTWVAYEDFGWACYHYGRWSQLEGTGWVWVPGYEWGPGWVSWRTGEDYVGWAPLPPKRDRQVSYNTKIDSSNDEPVRSAAPRERVLEGRVVNYNDVEEDYDVGYNAGVDVDYDIGPSSYCFVPVQNFGAPYVREFVVPPSQNVVIIENTTNVTNIVYRQGRGPRDRVVYAGGPDYNVLARRTERPVPRLLLERRTDVARDRAALRADQFNVIRENRLEVVAPIISRRDFNSTQVRPQRVKETLDRSQRVRGWRAAEQQDPRGVERLRTRFQEQARQAPTARVAAERFITPAAFRAQPPPSIQQQQQQAAAARRENRDNNSGLPPQPASAPGVNPNPAAANVPPAANGAPGATDRPGRLPRDGRPQAPVPAAAAPGAVQPVPPPANGRALSDAERQAKRDAKVRERDERLRGAGGVAPTPPPGVTTPNNPAANTAPPAPTGAAPTPAGKARTPEERAARREGRAQQPPAPTAPATAQPQPAEPAVNQAPPRAPAGNNNNAAAEAEREKAARRATRQQARESQQPPAGQPPAAQPPRAADEQAKEACQAARQQERQQQEQRASQQRTNAAAAQQQQQSQQANPAREERQRQRGAERNQAAQQQAEQAQQQQRAAGAERQQRAAAQQQAQQAQQAQQQQRAAGQGGEQRDAQRQQAKEARRAAQQPAPQAAPPQPGAAPQGGNAEEERKNRRGQDGQRQ